MDVGNNGMGVHDIMTNAGNDYTCVHREFGLEAYSQRWLYISNGTHVECKQDPVEVRLPSRNRVRITLGVDKSGDSAPFALFDDLLLDLLHSSAIQSIVSELSKPAYRRLSPRCQ